MKKSNWKKKGVRRRMAQGWECVAVEFGGTRPEAREYKTCVPWVAFVFPESETNEKLPYQYGCGCARCGRCECCGCCGDAVGGAGMMGCGCCGMLWVLWALWLLWLLWLPWLLWLLWPGL